MLCRGDKKGENDISVSCCHEERMDQSYQNNNNEYNNGGYNNNGYNNGGGYNNGNNGNKGPGVPGPGKGNDPKKQNIFLLALAAVITMIFLAMLMKGMSGPKIEVSYSEFIEMVEEDKVESVTFIADRLDFSLRAEGEEKAADSDARKEEGTSNGTGGSSVFRQQENFWGRMGVPTQNYYTIRVQDDELTQRLLDHDVDIQAQTTGLLDSIISILITVVLPIGLMWLLLSFLFRKMSKGGGLMGMGKSTAKVYVQKETGVTFKDVAGEDEAKDSLVEVVDFLHNPGKYSQVGAKLPKGALLVGPPGTGKTLLARAVAGEAKVPFFSLAGSDFIELYVGLGASRVRDLFREAEKNAPCIVFIDEIDAIGRSRDSKYGGGNEEREQTLNQLLSEMDGFDGKSGIIILAATNRPEILDKALLRPGRFDRRIIVDKPDLKGRVEILKVHAKDVLMDDSVDLNEIALATSGAVGSDLANMINEAAINAVKMGRNCVSQKDLFDAVEQVLVGKEKKDRIMSKEERRIVSYHETGHALVSALQKNSEPVQKITIVPRTMGALGYVMQVPEEEKFLNTEAELRDMLVGLLAGRAAEEIVFDTVTTGASNDIEKATNIARSMVTQYGMSKKFGLMGLESVESRYLDGRTVMNCSDNTAADVDTEVMKLLKDSYKEAKKLLKENRKLLDKLAEFLIEKETITGKEFMKIYRKEKGLPEPEEKPEEKKTEPNPGRQSRPGFNIPGNYGRPPIPPVGMGGSFQNGNPGMPQGNPYQNGNPGAPQGSPYQNGNPGAPQGNPYQNGNPGAPQGNPYQNGNPGAPQGNPYQNGNPGAPQGNPYQNGQPGAAQRNPYQNGNNQGSYNSEEPVNSRKEAWDAQYRQNHWSNQPENQPQGTPYENGNPGAPQGNPYQNGNPGIPQGNPYQNGNPGIPQGNPYQNGNPGIPQGNPYQDGQLGAPQGSPYPNGRPGIPQGNPYQNGMPAGMPEPADLQEDKAPHTDPNAGGRFMEQENAGQRGAFSGALQEAIEKPEEQTFVPYENAEKPEEAAGISESVIVDNEQDAEIVLEAAVEALKLEENDEGTDIAEETEKTAAEASDDTDRENIE